MVVVVVVRHLPPHQDLMKHSHPYSYTKADAYYVQLNAGVKNGRES